MLLATALFLGFYASVLFHRSSSLPSASPTQDHQASSRAAPALEAVLSDLSNSLKGIQSHENRGLLAAATAAEHGEESSNAQNHSVHALAAGSLSSSSSYSSPSSEEASTVINVSLPGSAELLGEVRTLNSLLKSLVSAGGEGSKDDDGKSPAAAAATTTTTAPTSKTMASKQKDISSLSSGRCLDMHSSYENNGIKVYGCNQGLGQSFFVYSPKTQLRHGTGFCIDSEGGKNGAVRLAFCQDGRQEQVWELVDPHRPASALRNNATGKCLDVRSDDYVISAPCTNSCKQRWVPNIAGKSALESHVVPHARREPGPNDRLLCWVLTQPDDHATKAVAINNTWGQHCDTLLFISTEPFPGLDVVVLDTGQDESRKILWMKTQQAWMYIYMNYRDKADWFFKADDDTYVVVPYLREFYSHLNPNEPAQYGRRLQYSGLAGAENTFVSGGAGLLLSRGALNVLGRSVQQDPSVWAGPVNGPADLLTSRTLHKLGVPVNDTRDAAGRQRFLTLGVETERAITRAKNPDVWLWKYSPESKEGAACCSPKWISSHYMKEKQMYSLHNLLQIGCAMSPDTFPFLEPPSDF